MDPEKDFSKQNRNLGHLEYEKNEPWLLDKNTLRYT